MTTASSSGGEAIEASDLVSIQFCNVASPIAIDSMHIVLRIVKSNRSKQLLWAHQSSSVAATDKLAVWADESVILPSGTVIPGSQLEAHFVNSRNGNTVDVASVDVASLLAPSRVVLRSDSLSLTLTLSLQRFPMVVPSALSRPTRSPANAAPTMLNLASAAVNPAQQSTGSSGPPSRQSSDSPGVVGATAAARSSNSPPGGSAATASPDSGVERTRSPRRHTSPDGRRERSGSMAKSPRQGRRAGTNAGTAAAAGSADVAVVPLSPAATQRIRQRVRSRSPDRAKSPSRPLSPSRAHSPRGRSTRERAASPTRVSPRAHHSHGDSTSSPRAHSPSPRGRSPGRSRAASTEHAAPGESAREREVIALRAQLEIANSRARKERQDAQLEIERTRLQFEQQMRGDVESMKQELERERRRLKEMERSLKQRDIELSTLRKRQHAEDALRVSERMARSSVTLNASVLAASGIAVAQSPQTNASAAAGSPKTAKRGADNQRMARLFAGRSGRKAAAAAAAAQTLGGSTSSVSAQSAATSSPSTPATAAAQAAAVTSAAAAAVVSAASEPSGIAATTFAENVKSFCAFFEQRVPTFPLNDDTYVLTDRLHAKTVQLVAVRDRVVLSLARARAWHASMVHAAIMMDEARIAIMGDIAELYKIDGHDAPRRLTPALARLVTSVHSDARMPADLARAAQLFDESESSLVFELRALFDRIRVRSAVSRTRNVPSTKAALLLGIDPTSLVRLQHSGSGSGGGGVSSGGAGGNVTGGGGGGGGDLVSMNSSGGSVVDSAPTASLGGSGSSVGSSGGSGVGGAGDDLLGGVPLAEREDERDLMEDIDTFMTVFSDSFDGMMVDVARVHAQLASPAQQAIATPVLTRARAIMDYRPNIDAQQLPKLPLTSLLRSPYGEQHFRWLLFTEQCSESLLFWLDVQRVRELFVAGTDAATMRANLVDIYRTYIVQGASYEINISSPVRRKLMMVFDAALRASLRQMRRKPRQASSDTPPTRDESPSFARRPGRPSVTLDDTSPHSFASLNDFESADTEQSSGHAVRKTPSSDSEGGSSSDLFGALDDDIDDDDDDDDEQQLKRLPSHGIDDAAKSSDNEETLDDEETSLDVSFLKQLDRPPADAPPTAPSMPTDEEPSWLTKLAIASSQAIITDDGDVKYPCQRCGRVFILPARLAAHVCMAPAANETPMTTPRRPSAKAANSASAAATVAAPATVSAAAADVHTGAGLDEPLVILERKTSAVSLQERAIPRAFVSRPTRLQGTPGVTIDRRRVRRNSKTGARPPARVGDSPLGASPVAAAAVAAAAAAAVTSAAPLVPAVVSSRSNSLSRFVVPDGRAVDMDNAALPSDPAIFDEAAEEMFQLMNNTYKERFINGVAGRNLYHRLRAFERAANGGPLYLVPKARRCVRVIADVDVGASRKKVYRMLAAPSDENSVWVGCHDGAMSLVDVSSCKVMRQVHKHRKAILALEIVGTEVWSSSEDSMLYCWDRRSVSCTSEVACRHPVTCIAQVDRSTVWCGDLGSSVAIYGVTLTVYGVNRSQPVHFTVPHGTPTCLLVVRDSVWLGTDRGVVAIYAADATRSSAATAVPSAIAMSTTTAATDSIAPPVLQGRELRGGGVRQQMYALVRVGDTILAAAKSPVINVWSLEGEFLRTIETSHAFSILAICSLGQHFVTAGWDKRISVWDGKTFEHVHDVPTAHEDAVTSLAFVPECRDAPLWSGSWDRSIRAWQFGL